MHERAFEQVRHGREPDVRVRPHVDALPRPEVRRSHVIEEDERTDGLQPHRGQHATHGEIAEVARPRFDDALDQVRHRGAYFRPSTALPCSKRDVDRDVAGAQAREVGGQLGLEHAELRRAAP